MKWFPLILTLLMTGCDNSDGPRVRDLKIWLQDPLTQLETTLGNDVQKDCYKSLCIYDFTKPFASGNVLNLQLGGNKPFTINGIFSLTAVANEEDDYHIAEIAFSTAGIPENSLHTDAIRYFYHLLDSLQAAGWHRFIGQYDPRLPGTEFHNTARIEQTLPVPVLSTPFNDPALHLNLAQWLSLPIFSEWYFYRGNEYLTIMVQRENSGSEPQARGNYMIRLTFNTEEDHYMDYVPSEDRTRWKALLPAVLKEMAQSRAQDEARLRAIGVTIEENYRDPTITALGASVSDQK